MTQITINFKSKVLGMPVMLDVLLPEKPRGCKTLYLLHGMGEDRQYWMRNSSITELLKDKQIAAVMPSGNNKFFMDNKNGKAYGRFLAEELPAQMEQWFGVSRQTADRFVAGADMGGFGAIYLAMTYKNIFRGAFSCHGILHMKELCERADERTVQTVFGSRKECAAVLEKITLTASGLCHKEDPTTYVIFEEMDTMQKFCMDECLREIIFHIVSEGGTRCQ